MALAPSEELGEYRSELAFDEAGTYMVHCHILEHEDMGLMRNIEVVG